MLGIATDGHTLAFDMCRPYKDSSPEESLARARTILSKLGLLAHETHWSAPYAGLYSVRIEFNEFYGRFGTNGKGQTRAYCLASAYGEMLERLQNGACLVTIPNAMFRHLLDDHGRYCFPDEVLITDSDICNLPDDVRDDIFNGGEWQEDLVNGYCEYLKKRNAGQCLAVPFVDWERQETVALPYNLLIAATGSNGMSAGNTVAEAMTQALFETFERWAASLVFHERLCPPEVPASLLQKYTREMAIIRLLEDDGYEVSVRDFSARRRLPAVGVVLRDRRTGAYQVNVGCDSVLQVALSRSLTELYQGIPARGDMNARLLPPPEMNPTFFNTSSRQAQCQREYEFAKFTEDGTGRFPASLFDDTPDYEFDEAAFQPRDSFEEEVSACMQLLKDAGHRVYVRDVSWLGFPACHVYVPAVSTVGGHKPRLMQPCDFDRVAALDDAVAVCMDVANARDDDLCTAAALFSELPADLQAHRLFGLEVENGSEAAELRIAMIEFALWYRIRDVTRAHRALRRLIEARQGPTELEDCALRWLELRLAGRAPASIPALLRQRGYSGSLAEAVHRLLRNPREIIRHFVLPTCPHCDSCGWRRDCRTRGYVNLSLAISAGGDPN